jgi:addiction module RelB/DinJ family antitoxin
MKNSRFLILPAQSKFVKEFPYGPKTFNALGFNLTTAINTFVKQALREQAIPFQPRLKRKSLAGYLEEYHGKAIETILREAEERNGNPAETDRGKPVGEEIW